MLFQMIKVVNEYPLIAFLEKYPLLSHLADIDKFDSSLPPIPSFRPLRQHNFDIYLLVRDEVKKSKPSQIYSFDQFQIIQVPNAQCYARVEEVQLLKQQSVISLTFSQEVEKKKNFFSKARKVREFTTQIFFLNRPNKALTIKSDSFHYVHFIDNALFFFVDEKRHFNFMQLEIEGQNITMKSSHIVIPLFLSPIQYCYGISNMIITVTQQMKGTSFVTLIDLITVSKDNQFSQITLSTRSIDARGDIAFHFNPKEHAVVLQQNGLVAIFNFLRREVLEFKSPIVQITNPIQLNSFEHYLAIQQALYQVLFSQGLLILFRNDYEKNTVFMIVISVSRYTKTQLVFTHVGKSQGFDINELQDIINSIEFIISENPQTQVSTISDAIKACTSYMSQFFSQTLNVQYIPYYYSKTQMITDYLDEQFVLFLKTPCDNHQCNVPYFSSKQRQKLNMDQISELIDRFGTKLVKLQNPQITNDEEHTQNSVLHSSSEELEKQKENSIAEASNSYCSNFNFNVKLRDRSSLVQINMLNAQSSQYSNSQSGGIAKQSNFIDDYFTQMNDSEASLSNDNLRTISKIDFLKPETMDVNFTNFVTNLQKHKSSMPVPAHMMGSEIAQIQRYQQFFSDFQTNSTPIIITFDYHSQSFKIVQFDFNLKNLQEFTNIMLSSTERDIHFQKIKLTVIYQTIKRSMFIEAYWFSGMMQEDFNLINSYTRNWQVLADKLIESQFIDTRFVANLAVTKTIVNCFMSLVNWKFQIPYLKQILYHLSYCFQALLSNQYDFIKLEDRFNFDLQQNPLRAPEFGTRSKADTPNQDSFRAESSKEFSKYVDENPYFLVEGDGRLFHYYEMPIVPELPSYDSQFSRHLHNQLQKMNPQVSVPRYLTKNMSSDLTAHSPFLNRKKSDQQNDQVFSKLYILFSQVRFLFPDVPFRNLYNQTILRPQHSYIHSTTNAFIMECKKIQKLATLLNQADIEQISNLISVICQNTVMACIDYMATKLIEFEELDENMVIALIEVVENSGITISKNLYQLILKFVGKDCDDTILQQLRSYLVII